MATSTKLWGMTDAKVARLTDADFATHALRPGGLVLVRFGATWSGPCRSFAPAFAALAADYTDQLVAAEVDVDESMQTVERLGVKGLPTVVLFKDGKIVAHWLGVVPRATIDAELAKHVDRPPATSGRTDAAIPALVAFKQQVADLSRLSRSDLAQMIRKHSVATHSKELSRIEQQIEGAHWALAKDLAEVVGELEEAVADEARPTYQRLGALVALYYGAAPLDGLDDRLAGGYGYLDDWLVLNAARWSYVRQPDPAASQKLAELCTLIWLSLPPAHIAPLVQLVEHMGVEAFHLSQQPDTTVRAIFAEVLARPAPVQFLIPQVASTSKRPDMGGWSTNAHGSIWGSGDGRSMYMSFSSGGSIGMVGDKLVGGP
jgi:thioredoxin 1